MNKLNRYREIENHLIEKGSGIDAIDEYVQKKIYNNNAYWVVVWLISLAISIGTWQY